MADNKLLPASGAGSVITVATDEIGGIDYQRVKVTWGADGTATDASATNPLPVVSAEALTTITVSPTVTNGAYSAADVVGGQMTFANAARVSGGGITIESLVIMCKTPALNNTLELWLFNASVTVASDNAAVSYSDADAAKCIGVIACGPWVDSALNSISTRSGIGLSATLAATSLYGQLVTRNGPTLTSTSDIAVTVVLRQG